MINLKFTKRETTKRDVSPDVKEQEMAPSVKYTFAKNLISNWPSLQI